MDDGALFATGEVAQPLPMTGGAAEALEQALAGTPLPTQYPVGVALARAALRAVDTADRDGKASVMAQLLKPTVEVLRPLGLMPADVAPTEGSDRPGSGEGARVLQLAAAPTVVQSA